MRTDRVHYIYIRWHKITRYKQSQTKSLSNYAATFSILKTKVISMKYIFNFFLISRSYFGLTLPLFHMVNIKKNISVPTEKGSRFPSLYIFFTNSLFGFPVSSRVIFVHIKQFKAICCFTYGGLQSTSQSRYLAI